MADDDDICDNSFESIVVNDEDILNSSLDSESVTVKDEDILESSFESVNG